MSGDLPTASSLDIGFGVAHVPATAHAFTPDSVRMIRYLRQKRAAVTVWFDKVMGLA